MDQSIATPATAPPQLRKPKPKSWRYRLGIGVWRSDQQSIGYLFLLPSLLGFLIFVLLPILISFVLSFHSWDILTPPEYIGTENYADLFESDPLFGRVLGNTFWYMIVIAPLQLVFGFMLAVVLNIGVRGLKLYRMIYFMPVVSSMVAAAMVFQFLFNRDIGVFAAWVWQAAESLLTQDFIANSPELTEFVRSTVRPPDWLNDPNWAKPGVALFTLWKNVGFTMVIYLAALQSVPQSLYEAAKVDGASWWQQLRNITVPMVSSTTFFLLIIQMLGAFQIFTEPFVMTANTQGQIPPASQSIVIYIYQNAFNFQKMGYASAIAWVLFAVVFALTIGQTLLQRRWVHYETD